MLAALMVAAALATPVDEEEFIPPNPGAVNFPGRCDSHDDQYGYHVTHISYSEYPGNGYYTQMDVMIVSPSGMRDGGPDCFGVVEVRTDVVPLPNIWYDTPDGAQYPDSFQYVGKPLSCSANGVMWWTWGMYGSWIQTSVSTNMNNLLPSCDMRYWRITGWHGSLTKYHHDIDPIHPPRTP